MRFFNNLKGIFSGPNSFFKGLFASLKSKIQPHELKPSALEVIQNQAQLVERSELLGGIAKLVQYLNEQIEQLPKNFQSINREMIMKLGQISKSISDAPVGKSLKFSTSLGSDKLLSSLITNLKQAKERTVQECDKVGKEFIKDRSNKAKEGEFKKLIQRKKLFNPVITKLEEQLKSSKNTPSVNLTEVDSNKGAGAKRMALVTTNGGKKFVIPKHPQDTQAAQGSTPIGF
jgi:hypothetical protein